ncbi:MAG: hypothetical protein A2X86_00055 [Bdellovibrionales bacterium GWA2_49_15]|nr:MAG: hypothetical protein A2X86_00055 [Bdellovibrionales bacterium GWA2_49_15]HAZ14434.1 hypothetical protein [Bdellovibrionales bacterium]
MKILLCCPYPLDLRLGAAKVYMEVARAFTEAGQECCIKGLDEMEWPESLTTMTEEKKLQRYPLALKSYIQKYGEAYDVIEYEFRFLPFARQEFPAKPLLVARSTLLIHHLAQIEIPIFPTWRGRLGKFLKGPMRRREFAGKIELADMTLRHADFINVTNSDDAQCLIKHGHDKKKIGVFSYALFPDRWNALAQFNQGKNKTLLAQPRLAFVGTFDNRKGAVEFPRLLELLVAKNPKVKIVLLGTSAMFATVEAVLGCFPEKLRSHIEVIEKFSPEQLPALLRDCSVGVFPSHLESFGYGILEMLAAGLPVVSYKTPGPPVLLPETWMVKRGDVEKMANVVLSWIGHPDVWCQAQEHAVAISKKFVWSGVAMETLQSYSQVIQARRGHK